MCIRDRLRLPDPCRPGDGRRAKSATCRRVRGRPREEPPANGSCEAARGRCMVRRRKCGFGMGSTRDVIRPRATGRPMTVFLVEDDLAVAALTAIWLRALNFEVIVSNDGPNADALASRLTGPVSYTHLRAHETVLDLVCRL